MRCGECGSRSLELQNAKGQGFPYKSYEKVIIKVDIDLMTCTECKNIIFRPGDARRVDKAIEATLNYHEQN